MILGHEWTHRTTNSPLLPPEILAIIFAYSVAPPIHLPPSPQQPALAIAGTCRSWRHIILNIPNLWCNISLNLTCSGRKFVELLEYAKLWLSRNDSLITLHYRDPGYDQMRWQNPITYLILPYMSRFRKIDLRFIGLPVDKFLTVPAGFIDNLEVLHLEIDNLPMSLKHLSSKPIEVFRSAPRLRRVLLCTKRDEINPQLFGLPWAQLTSVHFLTTYIQPIAMHAILRESVTLVECSFSIAEFDETVAAALRNLPECLLLTLRSLQARFSWDFADHTAFLRSLVLPALQDLEFRRNNTMSTPQNAYSLLRAYAGLFARSRFTLRRFAIIHYPIAADLDAILSDMPSLTAFHFWLWDFSDKLKLWDTGVLRGLADGTLLPRLEALTFYMHPLESDDVLDALEERMRLSKTDAAVARLQTLDMVVISHEAVPPETMARFMHLAEDGGPKCRLLANY
ncbi:hypothetical protein GGX14DRAFT_543827 [Mycena pura]|uniref:F-box domain-containing protein n=1 Tax=Mycena pura TaxID=153505 RepID=A0AAD6VCH8_9AGAR|nr:hypothetical protein GGX14DRAFT_543827 [Mycena pura]